MIQSFSGEQKDTKETLNGFSRLRGSAITWNREFYLKFHGTLVDLTSERDKGFLIRKANYFEEFLHHGEHLS